MVVMSLEAYEQNLFESEVFLKLKEAEYQAVSVKKRYTHDEVMAADLTAVRDRQLYQYIALRIYVSYVAGEPLPAPEPAYERCLIEVLCRMPPDKRESILGGMKPTECYPSVGMYVLEELGEEQRLLMGRIATRLTRSGPANGNSIEMIPSNLIYQFVQRAIARAPDGIFSIEGTEFPKYSEEKNGFNASMEMRPHENLPAMLLPNYGEILASMNQKIDQLGDIAVDVMDIILSRYIRENGDSVTVTTEEILKARGVKPKMKDGYSAGFRPEDKRRISDVLSAMDNLWITVGEMEVYVKGRKIPQRFREKSRLMMITGMTEQVALAGDSIPLIWQVRMGKVFSSLLSSDIATQYALLSSKTLQYDPYHQRWEKRLSRYFHPLWRIRQADESYSQPIRVKTLLDAIGMSVDRKNPQRTRERFEQAMDRLAEDGVLGGWTYALQDADETACERRGWYAQWLRWRVIALPNAQLLSLYRAGAEAPPMLPDAQVPQIGTARESTPHIDVRKTRKAKRITQAALAEALGVSRSLIAQIESGARNPSDEFTATFLAWLEER